MIYRMKLLEGPSWEGSLKDFLEKYDTLEAAVLTEVMALKPGEKIARSCFGFGYTITCHEDKTVPSEAPTDELMARAIETLLDALRARGVWPADLDVDLTGYEAYRSAHPRQDA